MNRTGQSLVAGDCRAANGDQCHGRGIRRILDLKTHFHMGAHAAEQPPFQPDIGDLAVPQPTIWWFPVYVRETLGLL